MASYPHLRSAVLLLCAVFMGAWSSAASTGADAAFVGVLALATEDGVADKLELSNEVREKLAALIEKREDEVSELVLQIKDLPPDQRTAKLAPFVAESEKQGLALLTDEQKAKLEQVRISRAGLATLAEPDVVDQLALSAEQKENTTKLLADMQAATSQGSELARQRAKADFERQLKGVLTPEQQAKWDALAGRTGTPLAAAPAAAAGDRRGFGGPGRRDEQGDSDDESEEPLAPVKDLKDVKLKFNFATTPWKDVIDWFAKQAQLSLETPVGYPPGTCNYRDTREYTPGEAIDVMNKLLSFKGFLLIRNDRLLVVWNLQDPVPHDWFKPVAPSELDKYGEFEFVRCLFQLNKMTAEEAEIEANKLKSADGTVITLPKSRQMYVTDMAGKIRTIRDVIEAVEGPGDPAQQPQLEVFSTGALDPTTAQAVISQLLINERPPVPIAVDANTRSLIVQASPRVLASVKATLDQLQRDGSQTKVFKLRRMDPAEVVLAFNSLNTGAVNPPKMYADSATMRLTVRGTKSQIEEVEQYLIDMGETVTSAEIKEQDLVRSTLRTIPLTGSSSRRAQEQIERLWTGPNKLRFVNPSENEPPSRFDESPTIKGAPSGSRTPQAATPSADGDGRGRDDDRRGRDRDRDRDRDRGDRGRDRDDDRSTQLRPGYPLRILPLEFTIAVLEAPLAEGEEQPAAAPPADEAEAPADETEAPAAEPAASDSPAKPPLAQFFDDRVLAYVDDILKRYDANQDGSIDAAEWKTGKWSSPPETSDLDGDSRLSKLELCLRIHKRFAEPDAPAADAAQPADTQPAETEPAAPASENAAADAPSTPESTEPTTDDEIVITITPQGWIITSRDTEALDRMEELLGGYVPSSTAREFKIFYLKYAKAETAANLLSGVISGSSGESGGGSLMGDVAAGMMGNMMGGMFGNMFGGRGGNGNGGGSAVVSLTGTVHTTADPRLNALFVQANLKDLDTIEQLLEVIDQPQGPEDVQTVAAPRFIPVLNAGVNEVANTVRQVYAGRIASESGGQQRQPSPEDFIRALRGGRGGSNSREQRGEEQKMTIGVDERSNTLIVSAPDYLFNEVKSLVTELDSAASQQEETVSVVKLERTSPDVISRSLTSVLGQSIATTSGGSRNRSSSSSSSSSGDRSSSQSPFGGGGFPGMGGGFNPGGFGGFGGGFPGGGGFNPGGFGGFRGGDRDRGDRGDRGGFDRGSFGRGGFGGFPGGGGFPSGFGGGDSGRSRGR